MKHFFCIAALCVTLSGCALLNASRFDPLLMASAVDLKHTMLLHATSCASPDLKVFVTIDRVHADELVTYTQYAAVDLLPVAINVQKMLAEMEQSYSTASRPTEAYCTVKYKILDVAVTDLIQTIGRKPR